MDEAHLESHSAVAGSLSAAGPVDSKHYLANLFAGDTISRATSPGLPLPAGSDEDDKKRYRPRTFSYFNLLPYPVEEEAERDAALTGILKNLYIAVKAEDFSPGALHWTRELQGWLNLKFEMTRDLRKKLAQLYYHLALAPGLDTNSSDRFSRMLITLTRLVELVICSLRRSPKQRMSWLIGHILQEKALPQARRRSHPRLATVMA